jgi:hypothetical protein
MKLFCALTVLAASALATVNPQLHQVKRVYILAMGSGMDQYLANQLAASGIFEVVTDPKKADAIFTDNIGEGFQKKLDDLYPPPKPAETAKPAEKSDSSLDVGDNNNNTPDTSSAKKSPIDGVDFSGGGFRAVGIRRGRGNFFVVDRGSRVILWSVYERPKDSTPRELTRTAERVVKHLKDDLTDAKPAE